MWRPDGTTAASPQQAGVDTAASPNRLGSKVLGKPTVVQHPLGDTTEDRHDADPVAGAHSGGARRTTVERGIVGRRRRTMPGSYCRMMEPSWGSRS